MQITGLFASDSPVYAAAPMINQSDLAFRVLTRRYGATLTYTQMLHPDKLLYDQGYLEHHILNMDPTSNLSGLGTGYCGDLHLAKPVVAQVCGNDVQKIVEACKKIVGHCDAIDLNLGCPLKSARDEHYGAYLLGQKDWPLVESIVSALSHTFPIPISTKIRLCNPMEQTLPLAKRLALAGSSWVALHARFGASTRKRRHGPAHLSQVKLLKEGLQVPVISNGNVRAYEDVMRNLEFTGANGIMVGETLLGNPWYALTITLGLYVGSNPRLSLFAGITPDPVQISLEYLEVCRGCPEGSVDLEIAKKHVKHFIDFQW
ncbi:FMN-linked oxidoreductase [Thelephora terrestris]|uniref:tRNA-dihydrouridine(16/17) synthase [NAD(P)(+)] n=1 Tax=Thelephora terrestris TaxID=56493 RepID=A0A9P6L986_9AGAM|nr:FMN-linked oxidoreductase [Thelephora terrestris]